MQCLASLHCLVLLSLPLDFTENLRHNITTKTLNKLRRHPLVEALIKSCVLDDAMGIKPEANAKTVFEQRGGVLARGPIQLAVDAVLERFASDGNVCLTPAFLKGRLLAKLSGDCVHTG